MLPVTLIVIASGGVLTAELAQSLKRVLPPLTFEVMLPLLGALVAGWAVARSDLVVKRKNQ